MAKNGGAFQRARQPEHKEIRRDQILASAGKLLDEHGVEGTGLTAITRGAGLSKASLYRYFESREAVLLQLLVEEQIDWCREMEEKLPKAAVGNAEDVADVLTTAIITRPRYCALMASLGSVLEHNLSEEAIIAFKRESMIVGERVAPLLHAALPDIPIEKCALILIEIAFAVSGFWPHCKPAPNVQTILKNEEFSSLRFELEPLTRSLTVALLKGHIE